jgi:hypothetical protein
LPELTTTEASTSQQSNLPTLSFSQSMPRLMPNRRFICVSVNSRFLPLSRFGRANAGASCAGQPLPDGFVFLAV